MLKKTLLLALLMLAANASVFAQDEPDSVYVSVNYISAKSLCNGFQVDARIVNNTSALEGIMDSLQKVDPVPYPLMSQWCRQQRLRIRRFITSLNEDYSREGEIIWLDPTLCINDAATVLARLEELETILQLDADEYDRLEQERIENERKAAEKRAREEARRIQQEKDLLAAHYKDTIRVMHNDITNFCEAKGSTDKARIKELKEIYFAYRGVYNRYDLTSDITDDLHFKQYDELQHFQMEVLDSLLGPNSFSARIGSFENRLRQRAAKEHNEVVKSYQRAFKKVQNPATFNTLAEYNEYVNHLRETIKVQLSYITAIELRETISKNTSSLQMQCSKKHKDVYNSYSEFLKETSLVPSYITYDESVAFIANLQEFIKMQQEYNNAIKRLDVIQTRGDSIISICPKNIGDVATAYKNLVEATDMVPHIINQSSADRFNLDMDNFEKLQQLYVTVIGIRIAIDSNSTVINTSKGAPSGLSAGYKQMVKYTDFTPRFNNMETGNDFINILNHFIVIQNKFKTIINNNTTIENNTKTYKSAFKAYSNISNAYKRLLKTYDYDLNIISEVDINNYIKHQESVLEMQKSFTNVANSTEKEHYNELLKKVKETDKIKLIMSVK